MVLTKTLVVGLRALWIAVFIISSLWFLYWIYYDVYVWSKTLTQVRLQNYFGLILSIALIVFGTQLGKFGISEKLTLFAEDIQKKQAKNKQQVQKIQQVKQVSEEKQIQPNKQAQQTQPVQPVKELKKQPHDSSIPPGCKFYLGYLHNRSKSVEIPEKCLECEYVVTCLSPTTQTIEA